MFVELANFLHHIDILSFNIVKFSYKVGHMVFILHCNHDTFGSDVNCSCQLVKINVEALHRASYVISDLTTKELHNVYT